MSPIKMATTKLEIAQLALRMRAVQYERSEVDEEYLYKAALEYAIQVLQGVYDAN